MNPDRKKSGKNPHPHHSNSEPVPTHKPYLQDQNLRTDSPNRCSSPPQQAKEETPAATFTTEGLQAFLSLFAPIFKSAIEKALENILEETVERKLEEMWSQIQNEIQDLDVQNQMPLRPKNNLP